MAAAPGGSAGRQSATRVLLMVRDGSRDARALLRELCRTAIGPDYRLVRGKAPASLPFRRLACRGRVATAFLARTAALGVDAAASVARRGRPPSRRHSRPRAVGTSAGEAGHRACAARDW